MAASGASWMNKQRDQDTEQVEIRGKATESAGQVFASIPASISPVLTHCFRAKETRWLNE
jgi:hypothetical protein